MRTMRLLLNAASDQLRFYLEMENDERKTALTLACQFGCKEFARALLLHGARLGHTMAVHMAITSGNAELIQLLLESRANFSVADDHGETSLHLACRYDRTDVLRMLLEHENEKIDLEVRDQLGHTPLLTAGYHNRPGCIRILLLQRADLSALDNCGRSICVYVRAGLLAGESPIAVAVHICVEQDCPDALESCLQWLLGDDSVHNLLAQSDQHDNTVLHTGRPLVSDKPSALSAGV